ncbi:MAG: RHS repeat-associated core domain-containing protein [Caldilineaceae bacterium]
MSVSGGATASFVYDGDNQRVKGTAGGVTTVYVGNYYEVAGSTVKKYYYAGNQRVAMKSGTTVNWLLGDHLGSTAYTINGTTETGEVRYYVWGKDRYTSGTTPTSYKFTGQREEASLGLYYYGARWYDRTAGAKHHPGLGRFIGSPLGADTVVPNPGDTQSFDHAVGAKRHRYAYTLNNPLKYVDPTGHEPCPSGNWGDCRPQLGKLESNRLAQHYHDLGVSWTAVPGDAKAVLTAQGETEGSYSDLGPGATVQTGLKDPATVAASLFGIGRLVWRLPALVMGACADGDCTNEVEAVSQASPSEKISNAYQIAKEGGKHAGFLRNYAGRSIGQIQKGISSIEQLIVEHQDKIVNPEKYIPNFRELDPRQQEALLTRKWPADIQRQIEQLEILKGLLDELSNQ